MRDGRTHRLDRPGEAESFDTFLRTYDARLIVVRGDAAGAEFRLHRDRHMLGRGPGVDLAVDDPAMSRQHAAIEYAGGGFRVRDLGSTNGVHHNGRNVQAAELSNGDRLEIGSQALQYVVEAREQEPEVYELSPEG